MAFANLATFIASTVSLPRAVRWLRHSAPITLLIAVAQVLVEGERWQTIPAYMLTGLFVLVWLRKNIAPTVQPAERTPTHRVAFRLAVGVGIVGLAVSIALATALPVFRFPHPAGPYEMGTMTYDWVDAGRREVFSADPSARRELMAQIWYPARKDASRRYRSSPKALMAFPASVATAGSAAARGTSAIAIAAPEGPAHAADARTTVVSRIAILALMAAGRRPARGSCRSAGWLPALVDRMAPL